MMSDASKDSGYVDNWQARKTVTECNLHMLTTEDCSDVIFRLGSEKRVVRAHRYILVSRSCVFHAMFCGPLSEKGEVTIPDIDHDVFRAFMRYLYTDTVEVTDTNAIGLLYTARKYAVDTLFQQCATFLEKSLSVINVCQILEQCHGYGELDLKQKALKILSEAGENVIKSPGFLDLCSGCFEKFLKSEKLKLKEEDVFQSTVSWAKKQCEKENISCCPENLRRVLGEMIYEIHFTSFSLEYLVNVVGPSQILTVQERMNIVDRSVNSNVDITPFKTTSRNISTCSAKIQHHYVNRFSNDWAGTDGFSCKKRVDALSFTTNKNIYLTGCQLYGPCTLEESTYSLNILLYDDQDKVIAEPVPATDRKLRGLKEKNDVMFPEAVPLEAGRYYTLKAHMTGEHVNYGKGGYPSTDFSGVQFTFRNTGHFGTTNIDQGQFPGLIWGHCNT